MSRRKPAIARALELQRDGRHGEPCVVGPQRDHAYVVARRRCATATRFCPAHGPERRQRRPSGPGPEAGRTWWLWPLQRHGPEARCCPAVRHSDDRNPSTSLSTARTAGRRRKMLTAVTKAKRDRLLWPRHTRLRGPRASGQTFEQQRRVGPKPQQARPAGRLSRQEGRPSGDVRGRRPLARRASGPVGRDSGTARCAAMPVPR